MQRIFDATLSISRCRSWRSRDRWRPLASQGSCYIDRSRSSNCSIVPSLALQSRPRLCYQFQWRGRTISEAIFPKVPASRLARSGASGLLCDWHLMDFTQNQVLSIVRSTAVLGGWLPASYSINATRRLMPVSFIGLLKIVDFRSIFPLPQIDPSVLEIKPHRYSIRRTDSQAC